MPNLKQLVKKEENFTQLPSFHIYSKVIVVEKCEFSSGARKLLPSFSIQSVNSLLLISGKPAKGSIHKNLASGSVMVHSATYGKSSNVKEILCSDLAPVSYTHLTLPTKLEV